MVRSSSTILVTGTGGLLGSHVATVAAKRGRTIAVDRRPWWGMAPAESRAGDLLEKGWIEDVVAQAAPTTIIHCAAKVGVDACEEDPCLAQQMNALLTRRIARAAPVGCVVVYISTDGLFDGSAPWATEATLPCPRTAYARSKLRGEWETQLATAHHLIVRTNFYGWSSGRKLSAAEWLHAALEARQPITMFQDFYFTPIYVVDLVERLWALIDRNARGIVHVVGADRVSKYDFALSMASEASLPLDAVRAGTITASALVADRPQDMSLRSNRMAELTTLEPPTCLAGLRRFVGDRSRPLHERFSSR